MHECCSDRPVSACSTEEQRGGANLSLEETSAHSVYIGTLWAAVGSLATESVVQMGISRRLKMHPAAGSLLLLERTVQQLQGRALDDPAKLDPLPEGSRYR